MTDSAEGNFFTLDKPFTNVFGPLDYVLFVATLVISVAIGVFFAIKDRKKMDIKDFLLAGGNMHFVPVTLSLLASFMSSLTLLGTPAEMYRFGTMFWWIGLAYVFALAMSAHIYVPIFYKLKITSAYEYLELRFDKGVRTMGTIAYVIQMTIYLALVLYGPSLALNAVTKINLWGAIFSVGGICTLYTALGGMKAVVWTDTFQIVIMMVGILATLIQGSIEVGGFGRAWQIAADNERINFTDFSLDPTVRHSVWSLVIGGAGMWLTVYTNQAQIQRTLTCKSLRDAKLCIWLNVPGLCIILYLCCMVGIVIYAFYSICDPLKSKQIASADQLYPLFVMHLLGHASGVPGLFVASIFSGTLSTMSSGLNSMSAVILEDIIKPYFTPNITEYKATLTTKLLAVILGILCLGATFIASQVDGILQAGYVLFGMIGAPMLGLFTLSMIFPWTNKWGAYSGFLTTVILVGWIGIGTIVAKPRHVYRPPLSTAGCHMAFSNTSSGNTTWDYTELAMYNTSTMMYTMDQTTSIPVAAKPMQSVLGIYKLSYLWYNPIAVILCVIVGLAVSFLTGKTDPDDVDPRLICPIVDLMFPCLPENLRRPLRFGIDHKGKYEVTSQQDIKMSKSKRDENGKTSYDKENNLES